MASLTTTRANRHASLIYVVVESGAISAVSSAAVVALSVNPDALTGLDVASQLAVCVHLSLPGLILRLLSGFIFAGINATLDSRAGWANWSISYSKFLENGTHGAGRDRIPSGNSSRGGLSV